MRLYKVQILTDLVWVVAYNMKECVQAIDNQYKGINWNEIFVEEISGDVIIGEKTL
jgi:hypothetical protein